MYFNSVFFILFLVVVSCSPRQASIISSTYPEAELGWKLGAQTYTFKMFSFFEALDKIDSCNLQYVEAYPSQRIGGNLDGNMDYHMPASIREKVLQRLKEKGLKLYAYGVVKINNEADWKQLFEFGKAMGIQTFTAEPDIKFIPLLSKLSDEYNINVAIHNHPAPSYYWNPDVVLASIKGQSKRIGACADIGHWIRSGLDPIECLKKLEGRVLHLHVKDLNEISGTKAHDVRWGTGVSKISTVVQELKKQNFKGMLSAEYEYNWYNNVSDVSASVEYFRKLVR